MQVSRGAPLRCAQHLLHLKMKSPKEKQGFPDSSMKNKNLRRVSEMTQ